MDVDVISFRKGKGSFCRRRRRAAAAAAAVAAQGI